MNFLSVLLNPHRTGKSGSRLLESLRKLHGPGSSPDRFARLLTRKLGDESGDTGSSSRSFERARTPSPRESKRGLSDTNESAPSGPSPGSSNPMPNRNSEQPPPSSPPQGHEPSAPENRSPSRNGQISAETAGGGPKQPRGNRPGGRVDGTNVRETIQRLSETYRNEIANGSSVEFTEEEKEWIRRIRRGDFRFDRPRDLRKLNQLLEKLGRSDGPDAARRGLDLAERLFSDREQLLKLLKNLLSGEDSNRAQKVLEGFEKLLGQLKEIAQSADTGIKKVIDQQLERSFREWGFEDPGRLSRWLSGSSGDGKSLGRGSDSTSSPPANPLAERLQHLKQQVGQLREALIRGDRGGGSSSGEQLRGDLKSAWASFTKQVRGLFSGGEAEGKTAGRSGSKPAPDWVNRILRHKLNQIQDRLKNADGEQKLRRLLNRVSGTRAKGKIADFTPENGTSGRTSSKPSTSKPTAPETEGGKRRTDTAGVKGRTTNKPTPTSDASATRKKPRVPDPARGGRTNTRTNSPARSERGGDNPTSLASSPSQPSRAKSSDGEPSLRAIKQQLAREARPQNGSDPGPTGTVEKTNVVTGHSATEAASKPVGDSGLEPTSTSSGEGPKSQKMAHYEANSARPASSSSGSASSGEGGSQQNLNRQSNFSFRANRSSFSRRSAEARRIIDQIVQRARTMVEEGKQTMRLQLKPESLGSMKLEVSLEAGTVSANFKVEKAPVKQTLNSHVNQLKQTLQQIGVEVDQIDISDMNAGTDEGGADWFEPESGSGRIRVGGGGETEGEAEVAEAEASTRTFLREYSTFEHVA